MIVGLGVELVERARFEAALERFGDRMRRRIFTAGERAYGARRAAGAESLGARFAAKVAAQRALDLPGFRFADIEVVREGDGPPALHFHGAARRAAEARGVARAWVSLSHDGGWCVGHVVLEGAA